MHWDTKKVEQPSTQRFLRPSWLEALRSRMARHRALEAVYRVVVLVIGLAVVVAGVAMLVFPGPGWAAIILGLGLLATEYRWAEVLVEPLLRLIRRLAARAKDPAARAQNIVFALVLVVAAVAAVVWYLQRYGWTLAPLPFIGG